MCFKQPSAYIDIQSLCDAVLQGLDSLQQSITGGSVNYSFVEKLLHVDKRVLVHRINTSEISNYKVEDTAPDRNVYVRVSSLIDGYFYLLSLDKAFSYNFTLCLWYLESIDEILVVEDCVLVALS